MNKQDLDHELIAETMSECSEQIDKTMPILLEIEKHEMSFKIEMYNEIFRTLHSVKGCISMVGLEEESDLVHHCESLFRQCLEDQKFYSGIIQITIEFLSHLTDYFSGANESYFELKKTKNCFNCVIKEKYLSTCPGHGKKNAAGESMCSSEQPQLPSEEPAELAPEPRIEENCPRVPLHIEKIMLVGDNPVVEEFFREQQIPISKISDIEEAYLLGKRLLKVETFLVDTANCSHNCLSFVRVINSLAPSKKILLLSGREMPSFNEMLDPDKMSFMFAGTNSRFFIKTLQTFLSIA